MSSNLRIENNRPDVLLQRNVVTLLQRNKIHNRQDRRQGLISSKQTDIKHNNHLKKQKFMALTHTQHKNISKYPQNTPKSMHVTINLQGINKIPIKQYKNLELQNQDQIQAQIQSVEQKIFCNQQLQKNLELLHQCSYETMTMPIKFKRFTGLLKKRYFYNSANHDYVEDSFPLTRPIEITQAFPQYQRHTIIIGNISKPLQGPNDQTKINASTINHFSAPVQIKKRPVSSARYKEDSLFCVKKRRKSVAQAAQPNSSLSFRHIEVLSCTECYKPKVKKYKADCPQINHPIVSHERKLYLFAERKRCTMCSLGNLKGKHLETSAKCKLMLKSIDESEDVMIYNY